MFFFCRKTSDCTIYCLAFRFSPVARIVDCYTTNTYTFLSQLHPKQLHRNCTTVIQSGPSIARRSEESREKLFNTRYKQQAPGECAGTEARRKTLKLLKRFLNQDFRTFSSSLSYWRCDHYHRSSVISMFRCMSNF